MRKHIGWIVAGVVAAGFATGCAHEKANMAGTAAPAPTASASGAAAKQKGYSCPMHADEQSDTPGKCSKCGMALEKRP